MRHRVTWVTHSFAYRTYRTRHLMAYSKSKGVPYKFVEQDVSMDSDKTVPLDIKLEPVGAPVPGPRGRIQIEAGRLHGATAAAVLLNGKKPLYFVGHVDEFDNDIIWHQELIVPPGTHQVTVTRYGKELWSGPITVAADQRVIVNISNGKEKTKPWARGSSCPTYPNRPAARLRGTTRRSRE